MNIMENPRRMGKSYRALNAFINTVNSGMYATLRGKNYVAVNKQQWDEIIHDKDTLKYLLTQLMGEWVNIQLEENQRDNYLKVWKRCEKFLEKIK